MTDNIITIHPDNDQLRQQGERLGLKHEPGQTTMTNAVNLGVRDPEPLRSKTLTLILTGGDQPELHVTVDGDWSEQELRRASQQLDLMARVKGGEGVPG